MRIKYQVAYVSGFLFSFSFWLKSYVKDRGPVVESYFFSSIIKKVNPAVFFWFLILEDDNCLRCPLMYKAPVHEHNKEFVKSDWGLEWIFKGLMQ